MIPAINETKIPKEEKPEKPTVIAVFSPIMANGMFFGIGVETGVTTVRLIITAISHNPIATALVAIGATGIGFIAYELKKHDYCIIL